jgi:hypothetical protein
VSIPSARGVQALRHKSLGYVQANYFAILTFSILLKNFKRKYEGGQVGKIVIWGLKSDFHSHKFIQGAFYRNFRDMGYEAIWVDDLESNKSVVNRFDIVFAVDVASSFLPIVKGAKYVLHNLCAETLGLADNYINLQVHYVGATGINLGIPYVHWDSKKRTLFQPWGVPTHTKNWKLPNRVNSSTEFWVGSIWNNDLKQGNSEFMEGYIRILGNQGIRFFRKGTPSRFQPRGISESKAMSYVNRSAVGAAVVGNWQKENRYIPCRLFKNISSGAIPCSNADFSELFGIDGGVFNENPEEVVTTVIDLDYSEKLELVASAQQRILPYTYHAGIQRILLFLSE